MCSCAVRKFKKGQFLDHFNRIPLAQPFAKCRSTLDLCANGNTVETVAFRIWKCNGKSRQKSQSSRKPEHKEPRGPLTPSDTVLKSRLIFKRRGMLWWEKKESVRRLRKGSWGKTSVFDWAGFQSPQGSSYFLLKKNKTSEPRHHNHIQPVCPIQKSILSFHEAVHPKPNIEHLYPIAGPHLWLTRSPSHSCNQDRFLLPENRLAAKQGSLFRYKMKSSHRCGDESF